MQNAKDTFYVTLRDRLAAVNPARTMVLRGSDAAWGVVEENELASAYDPADVFNLRWSWAAGGFDGALPLVAMGCEIRYARMGVRGMAGWIAGGCWRGWMQSWSRR